MRTTDHAPHTLDEKGCDINGKMTKPAIWECISGFCGVETNVPLMLTQVNKRRITLNHYVKVQSENVARVWQMYPKKGVIRVGSDGDLTLVDMNKEGTIDPKKLHSKNHPTPWGGWKVKGIPVYTIVRGHVQMKDGEPTGGVIGQMQTPIINLRGGALTRGVANSGVGAEHRRRIMRRVEMTAVAADRLDPIDQIRHALSRIRSQLAEHGGRADQLESMTWTAERSARFHLARREGDLAYREVFSGNRPPITLRPGSGPLTVHAIAAIEDLDDSKPVWGKVTAS